MPGSETWMVSPQRTGNVSSLIPISRLLSPNLELWVALLLGLLSSALSFLSMGMSIYRVHGLHVCGWDAYMAPDITVTQANAFFVVTWDIFGTTEPPSFRDLCVLVLCHFHYIENIPQKLKGEYLVIARELSVIWEHSPQSLGVNLIHSRQLIKCHLGRVTEPTE